MTGSFNPFFLPGFRFSICALSNSSLNPTGVHEGDTHTYTHFPPSIRNHACDTGFFWVKLTRSTPLALWWVGNQGNFPCLPASLPPCLPLSAQRTLPVCSNHERERERARLRY